MLLKDYIKKKRKVPLVLLWFENNMLEYKEVHNNIPDEHFLTMEVMEINEEENCVEVWLK